MITAGIILAVALAVIVVIGVMIYLGRPDAPPTYFERNYDADDQGVTDQEAPAE